MTDVVILCNGEFPRKAYPLYLLERAEAVVCCDGAAVKYLRKFGEKRMPEVVIGDMDSLPRRLREKLAPIIVRCRGGCGRNWRRSSYRWRNRTTMT